MKIKRIIPILAVIIVVIISIIYDTFPRLQLNGKKNIVLSYRDKYKEQGIIVKNANSSNVSKVEINNNIDQTKIGNYYVDYTIKVAGRKLKVRRNVKIIDNIEPVIKLKGDQILEMSINGKYVEPGYTANDEYDGDITEKVEIIGEVNTEKYGEYVLTYKVSDSSNNKVEVNRIVKIIDEKKPEFECENAYSAFEKGEEKIIGCKAIDNFDGDITEKVIVSGDYNINKTGIYKVKYTVKDEANNENSIEHNIIIYDKKVKPEIYITINQLDEEKLSIILNKLNTLSITPTIFFTEEEIMQDKNIKETLTNNIEIGVYNKKTYNSLEDFKNHFEQLEKKLREQNKTALSEYLTKIENTQTNEAIKTYLEKNNIACHELNTNTLEKTRINSLEPIDEVINKIIKYETITINEEDIDDLLPIIKILKQMDYKFLIINKI